MVWPSVVLSDAVTRMTVLPAERAYIFPEGAQLEVAVISVSSDENYYAPKNQKRFFLVASKGALIFDFEFFGEGAHIIKIFLEGNELESCTVYSVREDLYALTPLKGDFHSHSVRSDGRSDPAAGAGHYREQGYDFFALTDHNRFYPGEEIDEVYEDVDTGLLRIRGEEVHSPGSVIHIVHVGGRESVAARYVHDRERYDAEIEEYIKRVPDSVPEAYRERYAKAMWATDAIHSVGGLAIFPHPFWIPGSLSYNVCPELARILLKSGMFDAYEIVGAMTQADCNLSLALWNEVRAEGCKIPAVGSSDVHAFEKSLHFPYRSTVCFASAKEHGAIIDAVKGGMCVAVESNGVEYGVEHRCYGDFRLVAYAQFLLSHYFPRLARLTAGIGVAMRAYSMEGISGSLISEYNALADDFSAKFFGRRAADLPSEKMIEFEERRRAVQQGGPRTRGSSVDGTPGKIIIF